MSKVNPALDIIPRNSSFFLIWRIEEMKMILLPQEHHGCFYTEDSYIVVCAVEQGEPCHSKIKPKPARGQLELHAHFWIGAQTSLDESSCIAALIDGYFGDSSSLHREVQGNESKRFLSYFREGVRILVGCYNGGVKHIEEVRLFRVKGRKRPIIQQVKEIAWTGISSSDVFILDTRNQIFVWSGRYSNNGEKRQGAYVAQEIKQHHGRGSVVTVNDGNEKSLSEEDKMIFNKWLPLKDKKLANHREVRADAISLKERRDLKLYKCCYEGSTSKVTELISSPLDHTALNSQASYIVDNGKAGIWIWVGKEASDKEKREAMKNGQGFITKKAYPNDTQIAKVVEGREPVEFQSLFRTWRNSHQRDGLAQTVQTNLNSTTFRTNIRLAAELQIFDNGTGSKEIFRVQKFHLTPVDKEEHGTFFSENCYIVVYAYNDGEKDNYIVYYWLGANSSIKEQETAALKAGEIDEKRKGEAVQVRVSQGKEPTHFTAVFQGKMIILKGEYDTDRKKVGSPNIKCSLLLHIIGTTMYNTKAIEVEKRATSLDSNDVFLLLADNVSYIWAGKGSTGDEREMAKKIASQLGQERVFLSESQESPEFWKALGGKEDYTMNKGYQNTNGYRSIQLFQCSYWNGQFLLDEVVGFHQSDLSEDDLMLLDAWETIFIWVGKKANKIEKSQAINVVDEYLKTDPRGRDRNTSIVKIKQGSELPIFTGFFQVWNRILWDKNTELEGVKAERSPEEQMHQSQNNVQLYSPDVDKFPLEILHIKNPEELPDSVDPTKKEDHLTDDDFFDVFGLSYSEFQGLSRWRQVEMKKKAGLF